RKRNVLVNRNERLRIGPYGQRLTGKARPQDRIGSGRLDKLDLAAEAGPAAGCGSLAAEQHMFGANPEYCRAFRRLFDGQLIPRESKSERADDKARHAAIDFYPSLQE